MEKFARRTVKVTRQHNDECKRLLQLMGVPYVDAPTEAEARPFFHVFPHPHCGSLFRMCCAGQTRQSLRCGNRGHGRK